MEGSNGILYGKGRESTVDLHDALYKSRTEWLDK